MKFSKFSLFSKRSSIKRARSTNTIRQAAANSASCSFSVDFRNFLSVETNFIGTEANDWSCVVVKVNDEGRVAFRLFDPAGNTIGTVVVLTGYAGLVTAVNANATIKRYVTMSIVGSIANTQAFSADLTDYTFFSGGRG